MIEKKILVVEDSASTRNLLASVLKAQGFAVATAGDGKEALDIISREYFPLVLTDLEMPVMGGHELIRNLKGLDFEPVVLVLTSHDEIETVIDIMKEGVFDYVIKPMKADDLIMRINRALTVAEFKKNQHIIEKEKTLRLEQQLEWYRWEERQKTRGKTYSSQSLFSNLRTSFNQGAGLGMLVTLLSIISETAKQDDSGSWLVDDEIFQVLKKNLAMAQSVIERFAEVEWVITNTLPLEALDSTEVYSLIKDTLKSCVPFARLRNHVLMLNDYRIPPQAHVVQVNADFLQTVIKELVINALKFSEKGTNIVSMFDLKGGIAELSIINVPQRSNDEILGIPTEYENIIFEPFFRMGRDVHEEYGSHDFGLGLTLVEKIVQKHNGKIFMHNITDHTDLKVGPQTKVICTLQLPAEALRRT